MKNTYQIRSLKNNIWEHNAFGIVATTSVGRDNRLFIFRPCGTEVAIITSKGVIMDSSHKMSIQETKHILNYTRQNKIYKLSERMLDLNENLELKSSINKK